MSAAQERPIDPNVVATNAFLAIVVVILFGLMSAVFNSTIDDNRAEISASLARGRAGLRAMGSRLPRGRPSSRKAQRRGLSTAGRVAAVLILTGLIYGFLSPDFGLNAKSALFFAAMVLGLGLVTYVGEGGSVLVATRAFGIESSVRLFGLAVVVAVGCVLISRVTDFRPGFVYGFVASSILLGNAELTRRRSAALVILPSLGLLVVSLVAWRLLGPLGVAAQSGSWPAVLAETVAATVFIAGLEGLFYNMVPLTFMDGAIVYRWNRIVWAVLFGLATFLFWQLVINQYASYLNAFQNVGVLVCLAMLAVYGAVAASTWAFFRHRRRAELEPG